jgi:hypothetical protein
MLTSEVGVERSRVATIADSVSASHETKMRYYFDVDDGVALSKDEVGIELPDDAAAKLQGTLALTEMARDDLPSNGNKRNLSIQVRTGEGIRFIISLDYEVQMTSDKGLG